MRDIARASGETVRIMGWEGPYAPPETGFGPKRECETRAGWGAGHPSYLRAPLPAPRLFAGPMKQLSALALVFALTGITVLTTARPEAVYSHRTNVAVEGATVSDPDPADCPFCGGDPAIHIRRMIELQQQSMRLLAETWL